MNVDEHKPMVDEWFKMTKSFDFIVNGFGVKLRSERVTLFFKYNQETGMLDYDGWETYIGDMGIKLDENSKP